MAADLNNPFSQGTVNPFGGSSAPVPAPNGTPNPFDSFAPASGPATGFNSPDPVPPQAPAPQTQAFSQPESPAQPHQQQQQPVQQQYQAFAPTAVNAAPQQAAALVGSQQQTNPFGEMAPPQPAATQQTVPGMQSQVPPPNPASAATFGPPPTQVGQFDQQTQQSVEAPAVVADPFGQQPGMALAYQQPAQQAAPSPFGQPQPQSISQASVDPFAQALVPAQPPVQHAPSNPFGQQQALVPAVQQSSPWAATPAPSTSAPAPAAGNPFDPFAPPPPPAPAPPPVVTPYEQQALVPVAPGPSPYAAVPPPQPVAEIFGHQLEAYVPQEQNQQPVPPQAVHPQPPTPQEQQRQNPREDPSNNELTPYQQETSSSSPYANKYSNILAGQAPPDAAPLPQADKVIKSGYVLSRISFRTILLKKWKQSYWVQYGPHTMLWFRTYEDFDDWLNNPYHSQQQRNFLIKLAVNFVHDLYKPNVRGYQVTQARVKQYGRDNYKQFKLERWMDYGPTIAAAFASQDAREVDELRQALVECMRNTPVGDGVRATGAVRQDAAPPSQQQQQPAYNNYSLSSNSYHGQPQGGGDRQIPSAAPSGMSHASTSDLLDDHRAFDNQSLGTTGYAQPPQNATPPYATPYDTRPPQHVYHQQQQQYAHQNAQQPAYNQHPY